MMGDSKHSDECTLPLKDEKETMSNCQQEQESKKLNVDFDENEEKEENNESLKLLPSCDELNNEDNMEFYYSDYDDEESEDDESDDDGYAYDASNPEQDKKNTNTKQKFSSILLADQELPSGWERHEDELGPYFWHIPTGTIQREKPVLDTIDKSMIRSDSLVFLDKSAINVDYNPEEDVIEEENEIIKTGNGWKKTELNDNDDDDQNENDNEKKSLLSKKKIVANMRLTFPSGDDESFTSTSASEDDETDKDSYLVHSLGWSPVEESQINQQTGAMVIKRCIFELVNRSESAARAWETQSLIMKLSLENISLVAPNTGKVLSVHMIRDIRMWGVDEQNNFAFVVRDKTLAESSKVKCYVFHCDDSIGTDKSAHKIALYLKEALIRMKNRQSTANSDRPTRLFSKNGRDLSLGEFPTPLEEPKTIAAFYMGMVSVEKPVGVSVLNHAIEELVTSLKLSLSPEDSESALDRPVNVHISPANVIVECRETGATILECRVRYLSFLGISLDSVNRCGFIMQVDDGKLVAHCFHCYPTARLFCKSIEAACKLRYQKCMDSQARAQRVDQQTPIRTTPTNGQSPSTPIQTIRSSISSLFSRIVNK